MIQIENSFALKSSKSISPIEKLRKKYVLNNRVLLIQAPQFLLNSFNVTVAKNRGYYALLTIITNKNVMPDEKI